MPLLLKNKEMEGLLSMSELIPAVEQAFRELGQGIAVNLPRARIRTPKPGSEETYFFNNIAGAVPGFKAMALRIDSSSSRDVVVDGMRRREYPGDFVGLVFLFSMETNELLAIMDDHYLSVMRVGATSGVGTKWLAREDSHTLGLFGSGHQARTQVMAVCAVRPIRKIKVYSPNREHREKFAVEMSRTLELEVVPVESPRAVIRGADIVTAATNAIEPVLKGEWLEPGMHINSIVGGDVYLRRRELDDEAVRRSDVIVVNFKPQIFLDKQGDIYEPLERGIIAEEKIQELGALLNGKATGRTRPEQITLFKNNTGMGIQFAATAMKIYEKAKEQGTGTELSDDLFMTRRGEERYSP